MARRRELANRVALVTGAARGIGRAICAALLREGVAVVATDLDERALRTTARELAEAHPGGRVHPLALDVTDQDAFRRVVAAAEGELGPVDILVNNAGIMAVGAFLDQAPDADRRQVEINLFGVVHGLRAVLPGMRARGAGHVVNVASLAGRVGTGHIAMYSATKHAVVGLTESARRELRGQGLDFSYVLPAFVETELIAGTGRPRWPRAVPPEVVADAVVRALRTGRVELYVPRSARIATILPVVLPRPLVDALATALGLDGLFTRIDAAARASYQARIDGAPGR